MGQGEASRGPQIRTGATPSSKACPPEDVCVGGTENGAGAENEAAGPRGDIISEPSIIT